MIGIQLIGQWLSPDNSVKILKTLIEISLPKYGWDRLNDFFKGESVASNDPFRAFHLAVVHH